MKVVQINAVYKNLSTGRTCFELDNFLANEGCDSITIYGECKGNYDKAIFVGNIISEKAHALLSRLTGKIGYFSKWQTKKIINILKKGRPDVVLLCNLHANFVDIPKLLRYLAQEDIVTVIILHDCFFYTGQCCHYASNGCDKWRTECSNCKFNKSAWLFDRTKKMFDDKRELFGNIKNLAVVGVSDWITNEAKQSPILGGAKVIRRIYNGIDLEVFRKLEGKPKEGSAYSGKKIILGVASGWSDKKGLEIFNELAERLDENETIVLVGNIGKEKLNRKIVNIPATENVEKLVEIYNAADVFVQASKEETFGKVVAESLACGTPVVTNGSTANPELVNKDCGIVVNDFAVENVYAAIKEVLNRGKSAYSESCIKFAKDNFDNGKNYNEYLALFKEMLKGKIG